MISNRYQIQLENHLKSVQNPFSNQQRLLTRNPFPAPALREVFPHILPPLTQQEKDKLGEEEEEEGLGVRPTSGNNLVGMAKLNNIRASRVFTHVVDPLCSLRGMDLFVTDAPEEDIWRQPMLNE